MSASTSALFSSRCAADPTAITRAGEDALLEQAGQQERAEEVLREAAVDAFARVRGGRRVMASPPGRDLSPALSCDIPSMTGCHRVEMKARVSSGLRGAGLGSEVLPRPCG
jgi:hypothetical protein